MKGRGEHHVISFEVTVFILVCTYASRLSVDFISIHSSILSDLHGAVAGKIVA
jgi:hypothetical protein